MSPRRNSVGAKSVKMSAALDSANPPLVRVHTVDGSLVSGGSDTGKVKMLDLSMAGRCRSGAEGLNTPREAFDGMSAARVSLEDDTASSIFIDEAGEVDVSEALDVLRQYDQSGAVKELNEYESYILETARNVLDGNLNAPLYQNVDVRVLSEIDPSDSREVPNVEQQTLYTIDVDGRVGYAAYPTRRPFYKILSTWDYQTISLVGNLPMSFFFNAGAAIALCGPVGAVSGFVVGALFVYVMITLSTEMLAFVPTEAGLPGIISMFVDPSAGYAIGILFWIACVLSAVSELVNTVTLLSIYPCFNINDNNAFVWISLFILILLAVHCLTPRIVGRMFCFLALVAGLGTAVLYVLMLVVNAGGLGTQHEYLGFRYFRPNSAGEYGPWGPLRPAYGARAISGAAGQFLQIWRAIIIAAQSYAGTSLVYAMLPNVRNPRQAVKSTPPFFHARSILLFVVGVFIVATAVDPADPFLLTATIRQPAMRLDRSTCGVSASTWSNFKNGFPQHPWLIALWEAGSCSGLFHMTAFMSFVGLLAALFRFHAAVNILRGLAAAKYVAPVMGRTTRDGQPYVAVLATFPMLALAYVCGHADMHHFYSFLNQAFSSVQFVLQICICYAFIQFQKSLEGKATCAFERKGKRCSRARRLMAYSGIFCGFFLLLFSGYCEQLSYPHWQFAVFASYFCMPLAMLMLFLMHKRAHGTKRVRAADIDPQLLKDNVASHEWEESNFYEAKMLGSFAQTRKFVDTLCSGFGRRRGVAVVESYGL